MAQEPRQAHPMEVVQLHLIEALATKAAYRAQQRNEPTAMMDHRKMMSPTITKRVQNVLLVK
jgi:hypothetical protein